jgi:regulator of protease activity HflC (stomatin/prohibitin superfamily)
MNSGIVLLGIAFVLLIVLMRSIKIVPQKQVKLIERLGKYHRTAEAGLNTIVPFLDAVRDTIDLREQITKIEPQPVITRDNVTMEVDAVIYYLVADPVRATYEVQNLRWGLEQLTLSALRNVIGQLDLDHTLASRDTTNSQLRAALDTATQQWGVKVMRIELKNITPPEDDGKADDRGADAARGRHDGGGREERGDPARRGPEAVADRAGRRIEGSGNLGRRRSGPSPPARRPG